MSTTRSTVPISPPRNPSQVFFGESRRHHRRGAEVLAGEVGHGVARPRAEHDRQDHVAAEPGHIRQGELAHQEKEGEAEPHVERAQRGDADARRDARLGPGDHADDGAQADAGRRGAEHGGSGDPHHASASSRPSETNPASARGL